MEVDDMTDTKRLAAAERKKEIMNSAAKVITERGLEKATMEDIIAGTTLSKGGVYHYYRSVNEIFKDIMRFGIEYRNNVIKEHLSECKKGEEMQFMARQLVDKIVDDNPYMPLYVEFLIAKKRNPELNAMMLDLQAETMDSFKGVFEDDSKWLFNPSVFQFVTDYMNALILASNILEARENFKKNRRYLEDMMVYLFEQGKENSNGSL
jgi:transcriptional regulator, TetR family